MRANLVEWRPGLIFAFTGILGASLSLMLGRNVPDSFLLPGFATLTLLVITAMWRQAVRELATTAVVRAGLGLDYNGTGGSMQLQS